MKEIDLDGNYYSKMKMEISKIIFIILVYRNLDKN